jgi:hypothetical protein
LKKVLIILLGVLPMLSMAVPEASVYPNSGTTDAKRDDNSAIDPFPSAPIPPGAQEEEENPLPENKGEDFISGPYDKEGNYLFVPKVKEEKTQSE